MSSKLKKKKRLANIKHQKVIHSLNSLLQPTLSQNSPIKAMMALVILLILMTFPSKNQKKRRILSLKSLPRNSPYKDNNFLIKKLYKKYRMILMVKIYVLSNFIIVASDFSTNVYGKNNNYLDLMDYQEQQSEQYGNP